MSYWEGRVPKGFLTDGGEGLICHPSWGMRNGSCGRGGGANTGAKIARNTKKSMITSPMMVRGFLNSLFMEKLSSFHPGWRETGGVPVGFDSASVLIAVLSQASRIRGSMAA